MVILISELRILIGDVMSVTNSPPCKSIFNVTVVWLLVIFPISASQNSKIVKDDRQQL